MLLSFVNPLLLFSLVILKILLLFTLTLLIAGHWRMRYKSTRIISRKAIGIRITPTFATLRRATGHALSRRVRPCLWIARHIHVRARALCVALHGIHREELTHDWIIIADHVIVQPRHAVGLLTGEANTGGQRARAVAGIAIGSVELGADEIATAVEHHHLAAQGIVAEVVKGAVDVGRNAFALHRVIGRGRLGAASGLYLLDAADISGEGAGAVHAGEHSDTLARAIIEIAGGLRGRGGLALPGGKPSLGIVTHLLTGGRAGASVGQSLRLSDLPCSQNERPRKPNSSCTNSKAKAQRISSAPIAITRFSGR